MLKSVYHIYAVPVEDGIGDPLGLELQAVVSCQVGARNCIEIWWKSS